MDRSKIDDGRRQRGIGIGVGVFLQLLGATSRSQLGDQFDGEGRESTGGMTELHGK